MTQSRRWWIPAIAALLAVPALVLVARELGDSGGTTTTSTTVSPQLHEAALRADVRAAGVEVTDVEVLIEQICRTRDAATVATRLVALGLVEPEALQAVVEDVGRGAAIFCPDVAAAEPQLLNDIYNAALAQVADE